MSKVFITIKTAFTKLSAYHKAYSSNYLWPLILPFRQLQLKQIAKKVAALSNCGLMLDIGTGYGYLPGEVAKRCPDVQIVGIDLGVELINDGIKSIRDKRLTNRISFLRAKAEFLPFADNIFDMVVSTMSLHLWHDRQCGINEVRRVLKPGGRCLVLVGRSYLLHGLEHITDYFTQRSISQVSTLLDSAGFKEFKVVKIDDTLEIIATK